jgi:hypothetical protein
MDSAPETPIPAALRAESGLCPAEIALHDMDIKDALHYINSYSTEDSVWVPHRTLNNVEIEEEFPHRIRYSNSRGKTHIRKLSKLPNGYLICGTRAQSTETRSHHIIVALHFIDNPENKHSVIHINGCRHDNHITNLRWTSAQEKSDEIPSTPLELFNVMSWVDTPPSDYIELTTIGGKELLPHTYFQIGDMITQRSRIAANETVRYRIVRIFDGRPRRDGTRTSYRRFRDINNVEFKVSV